MKQQIKIGNKIIAEDQPLFICAEIGVTCNYNIKLTKDLIDVVHRSGADAVKLIFWFPEEIMSDKTITYTGSGAILAEGNVQINANLVTNGNGSFPTNIVGIMTPNTIGFNEANIDVMGLFYAEDTVQAQKQTDIIGTVVSNYFDMGTNVPSVYQVPDVMNHLPTGLIGQGASWVMKTVSWQKI